MAREALPGAWLTKGITFRSLDRIIGLGNPTEFRKDLASRAKLGDLGIKHGVIDKSAKTHVEEDAFGGFKILKAWWPGFAKKEEIVREGYALAYEKAGEGKKMLPIITYWVTGGNHFEIAVARSDHQVTVFLATPPPPPPTKDRKEVDEDIWFVATTDRIEEIASHHRTPPTTGATRSAGVRWLRVKDR